jgi:hypothetical protein
VHRLRDLLRRPAARPGDGLHHLDRHRLTGPSHPLDGDGVPTCRPLAGRDGDDHVPAEIDRGPLAGSEGLPELGKGGVVPDHLPLGTGDAAGGPLADPADRERS